MTWIFTSCRTGRSTLLSCEAFTPQGSGDFEDCALELSHTWGPDLAHFNVRQAGQDLGYLIERTRLPDAFITVYGVSYGTYWAQHYLKAHPNQDESNVFCTSDIYSDTGSTTSNTSASICRRPLSRRNAILRIKTALRRIMTVPHRF